MKKFACLGLVAMMAIGMAGCSKSGEETVVADSTDTVAQEEIQNVSTTVSEEEESISLLTDEDLMPFFKDLYSFTEEQFDLFNQNIVATNDNYFSDLDTYRKAMKEKLGKYLSEDETKKLKEQNVKLDFDLPKKSQINDYVAEATGEVESVSIESLRELDNMIAYEVKVVTTNKVVPQYDFIKEYGWDKEYGYYRPYTSEETKKLAEKIAEQNTSPSYAYAEGEGVVDKVKLASTYWIYVQVEKEHSFKVCGLKQGGNFQMDYTWKQKLDNTDYIDRIPYYSEVADKEMQLMKQLMKTLLTSPKETFIYYEKIYDSNFDLMNNFWNDLGLTEKMDIKEDTYLSAFNPNFNPYKDDIAIIRFDENNLTVKPSIYSTQLQPAFVVSAPVEVVHEDNTIDHMAYKYYVGMENNKIETIQFIKMEEVTLEADEAGTQEASGEQQGEGEPSEGDIE